MSDPYALTFTHQCDACGHPIRQPGLCSFHRVQADEESISKIGDKIDPNLAWDLERLTSRIVREATRLRDGAETIARSIHLWDRHPMAIRRSLLEMVEEGPVYEPEEDPAA